jgi:hypothetical protein
MTLVENRDLSWRRCRARLVPAVTNTTRGTLGVTLTPDSASSGVAHNQTKVIQLAGMKYKRTSYFICQTRLNLITQSGKSFRAGHRFIVLGNKEETTLKTEILMKNDH